MKAGKRAHAKRPRHPLVRERFRSHIANRSIVWLVCEYLVLLTLVSIAGALSDPRLWKVHGPLDFPTLWMGYFSFFIGGQPEHGPIWDGWAFAAQLLQVFLLGGLVFKLLLTSRVFVFRKDASLFHSEGQNCWILVLRLYNATKLQIRGADFSVFLRVPVMVEGEKIVRNFPLRLAEHNHHWRFAQPSVPYTVKIRLDDGDVVIAGDRPRLSALQGKAIQPAVFDPDGDTFLVLCVDATSPRTGLALNESCWYRLTAGHGAAQITWGRPNGVQSRPARQPGRPSGRAGKWEGWEGFEDVRRADCVGYVLGYGSLVHPQDAMRLLSAYDLSHERAFRHEISGYRLAWNVAMDNKQDLPGYKYYTESPSGRRPGIFVTFLNIEPHPSSSVHTVALPVGKDLLDHLDARERNYSRQQIASSTINGRLLPMWVYIGNEAASDSFRKARGAGTAVIAESYLRNVRQGYAELRESAAFPNDPTPPADLRIVDLVSHKIAET